MKRKKLSKKRSIKKFRQGLGVHKKNIRPLPTRGGYRL